MFEYLEHSSDIKIRVKERNEFNFFSDIVKSVNSAIFDFKPNKSIKYKKFIIESKTYDQLIRDFVDEVVYFANQNHVHTELTDLGIEQKKDKLVLICTFGLYPVKKENYKVEVKAVSFNVLYKENEKTKEKTCEFLLDT